MPMLTHKEQGPFAPITPALVQRLNRITVRAEGHVSDAKKPAPQLTPAESYHLTTDEAA